MRYGIILALLTWVGSAGATTLQTTLPATLPTTLPRALQQLIADSPVTADNISIWVAPTDNQRPLLAHRADVLRSPASVAKVISTGVGLVELGNDFRWKTEFYSNGKIRHGVLNGDLYIKGYGNPYFVQERLAEMIDALRQKGINRINGKVVLDNRYFIDRLENPDAFDGQGIEPYNALPNALSINFRTVELVFSVKNGVANVVSDPPLSQTTIDSLLSVNKAKSCRGKGFSPQIDVDYDRDIVTVSGSLSPRCHGKRLTKVISEAGDVFYANFRKFWQQSGGEMGDQWHYGSVKKGSQLLYRSTSKPLSEQIEAMNKFSNNIMTRQLFLTLGAEKTRPPATLNKARAVVMNRLKKMGVPTQGFWIDNGSGLSRKTRMTAEQIGRFLQAMTRQKQRTFFENSLAVAGVDGTMRRRLRNTPLDGNVVAKTGTLDGVKSIAGYLTAESGQRYSFVILVEGVAAKSSRTLMDNILQWIYRQ